MMDPKGLRALLSELQAGRLSVDQTMEALAGFPYEAIDDVLFDHHRLVRKGLPEIIYGPGKPLDKLISLARRLASRRMPFLITRLEPKSAKELCAKVEGLRYDEISHCCWFKQGGEETDTGATNGDALKDGALIVTAGTADLSVAREAAICLELMGIYKEILSDVGVAGIHRLFDQLDKIVEPRVIIAIAGMEGALPSVIAGISRAPVIAVPTSTGYGSNFKGVVPLLAMLNSCAPGIGVVNIDNGVGAALLAASIIRVCQR
ncbi:MAG: nickel pincer cofactor biosynthesis protein LarB, partial [Thermodesulfobacteria bacterium]|nr:nickel pincer cofactor biosynthesis protein LarB [Thermodesulfobacteriota bacterium]